MGISKTGLVGYYGCYKLKLLVDELSLSDICCNEGFLCYPFFLSYLDSLWLFKSNFLSSLIKS